MFVVHGPVRHNSQIYIPRRDVRLGDALDEVAGWLSRADSVGAILGARQTGKTSFCHELRARMSDRYGFCYIDFQEFDGDSWNQCVVFLADRLALLCDEAADWPRPGKGPELSPFLRKLAPCVHAVRIAVIFEELGHLPGTCRTKLANTIRALFNARLQHPVLERFVFIVVGSYELRDLAGTKTSPLWNVARKLWLADFTPVEVKGLVQAGIADEAGSGQGASRMADFVHEWTSGHPYWTQRLAMELETRHLPADPEFGDRDAAQAIARDLIRTEESNLQHMFALLEQERDFTAPPLETIRDSDLEFSRFDRRVASLELIGAIKEDRGRCVIRNRIYEHAIATWLSPGNNERPAVRERATLVNIDMIGYSEIAEKLHYWVGADALALLGDSIQEQIRAGLRGCGLDERCIYSSTGDGAILRFAEARHAHEFAVHFYAVVEARNREIPHPDMRRHYRMGAATGDIAGADGDESAGLVFTHATRLETGGAHGQLLIDIATWSALPRELAALYGPEEQIMAKNGMGITARRLALMP